jgi:NTE family protein
MKSYTQNTDYLSLVERLKSSGLDKKCYSDLIDSQGNQYVDLVQEGGGVLGIALVGYTSILEEAGIRFYSLAGTSAGAINTLMIASLAKVGDTSSDKILPFMQEKNLFDLVDGDKHLKKLMQRFIDGEKLGWVNKLRVLWNTPRIYRTLNNHLGINPGNDFQNWIQKRLAEENITTWAALRKHRMNAPDLIHRDTNQVVHRSTDLKIIASDVTSKSKVTFPDMANAYWSYPDDVCPSNFVRASMSIPFFFYPYTIEPIPQGEKMKEIWEDHFGYKGEIPNRVRFVDGGMLSNFPINAFHAAPGTKPLKPTFGARLSAYRNEPSKTEKLFQFCGAMVSTMRQLHDYDFLLQHPDYKHLICSIDADLEYDWLDFNMSDADKVGLFNLGARKAVGFLEGFDWKGYQSKRMELS